ncbi:MAG: penicillin-binding protein [Candidatus Pacebacteria bacterium]|nr:penicillin-binding protein [Candidatus Paceibacterota bacterium]
MLNIFKRFKKNKHFWKNVLIFGVSAAILFIGLIIIWLSSLRIPDFNSFNDRKVENSTKIYDRTGEILLYDIHNDTKRTDITFEQMGPNIKNATIAIEDSEFYNHHGVRVTSTARAILSNLFGFGIGGGGSTITQQLVKNTLLTPKRSPIRKMKEWVLAVKIDGSMPKDKILEYYLNENPYGGTIYGIEEASKTYFNKHAVNLTIAEAAYLAAIPQSPTYLSPYGKNKDKLETRKNLVLSRELELKFITQAEYDAAKTEVVVFQPQATTGIKAPHFVFFIKDYLEQKYGADMIEKGGLKVTTTINYDLQSKAEEFAKVGALQNEKDWNGKNTGVIAIDPKTGQILTMVGSRNYFDKEIDGNFNITTANRQPGSSFKPFIYATAFSKGFTPDTVLFDLPTEFQTTCNAYGQATAGHKQSECYMPDNYDGKFRGPMKLRDALAQSINVPAVKLFYLTTPKDSLAVAEKMGITTLGDIGQYGLTLVIGGGEVSLLDITSAYGVLANDGIRNNYTGVLKIEDTNGNILEEYIPNSREVLPKNSALMVSDILKDNVARTPTFGANSILKVAGHEVAVKTGTTNNNKDAWTIGYTPSIVVGVWAGNNDNKPMTKGGSTVAGPIWNKVITEALKTLPNEKFETPDLDYDELTVKPILRGYWSGNDNFFIDKISGKLATVFTPKETRQEKVITNVHSILYWLDRSDITGPAPTNPANNSQFNHWEIPVQNWWANNKQNYPIITINDKPVLLDDIHTESSKPVVVILQPDNTTTYPVDQNIQVKLSSMGTMPISKADIFINDVYLGTTDSGLVFSFSPRELDNLAAINTLKIIAYDTAYNIGEVSSTFRVK